MALLVETLEPGLANADQITSLIIETFSHNDVQIAQGYSAIDPIAVKYRTDMMTAELIDPRTVTLVVRQSEDNYSGVGAHKGPIVAVLVYLQPWDHMTPEARKDWESQDRPDVELPSSLVDIKVRQGVRDFLLGVKNRNYNAETDFYLSWLATKHEMQGKGIASMLMELYCKTTDMARAVTFVTTGQGKPIYDKFGFEVREQKEFSWDAVQASEITRGVGAGSQMLYGLVRPVGGVYARSREE